MEVHFRDILVSLRFSDFSFNNPVPIKWEQNGDIIGSAVLTEKKKKVFADLVIKDHIKYQNVYPHVAIDATTKQIGYVFLDQNKGIDPEVLPLKEQLLQQK